LKTKLQLLSKISKLLKQLKMHTTHSLRINYSQIKILRNL
jgi:hypothetical protein